MAKPNYSYEKRQRELNKKRKKEEKRKRKAGIVDEPEGTAPPLPPITGATPASTEPTAED